ncbi:YheC/YheD family protein [Thermoflavimicrobium daqui]|uniref:Endospore coat-associated protein n=1 Tax=Thermoflavimicrobium daqui TaxID=2137476 RepID=A0A364K975_9BACL|nr:YheC/YheD family protein [Thermoflavimicrobium daqui]RAL26856.1 endospore coat-associated protein [Thermoflavimicrobium daqui]
MGVLPAEKGPYVAIFTSDGGSSFRGNHQNFIDLIMMGKKMGIKVFVLTPSGLQIDPSSVIGYTLTFVRGKPRWKKTELPFPQVIYNRIPNRQVEQSDEVQSALARLKSIPEIHLFNPHFFDKWTIYQHLRSDKHLRSYLPDSILLHDLTSLKLMLFKYPILYLKPIHSKAGIGMIRITLNNKEYEIIYQQKNQKKKYYFTSFQKVWSLIQKLCESNTYLIQQGITLAQYHNKFFDVRVLVQKDAKGIWDITGMGIRLAGRNAISTHVPMGGSIENFDVVIKKVFGSRSTEIANHLKKASLSFAKAIEEKEDTNLGEMSMDIGIDKKGNLWFFEANAKPMKFDEPEIRSLSLQKILEYSRFLSLTKNSVPEVKN